MNTKPCTPQRKQISIIHIVVLCILTWSVLVVLSDLCLNISIFLLCVLSYFDISLVLIFCTFCVLYFCPFVFYFLSFCPLEENKRPSVLQPFASSARTAFTVTHSRALNWGHPPLICVYSASSTNCWWGNCFIGFNLFAWGTAHQISRYDLPILLTRYLTVTRYADMICQFLYQDFQPSGS